MTTAPNLARARAASRPTESKAGVAILERDQA
jgi:hypothetical protein